MALFVVSVDSCDVSIRYFKDLFVRMSSSLDWVKKPYNCGISKIGKGDYAVDITPVYPRVYWGGLFFVAPALIFFSNPFSSFWSILLLVFGGFIFSLGFLWSKYFYFIMFFFGLKKAGYNGKIKLLSSGMALRRFYDGSNRSL